MVVRSFYIYHIVMIERERERSQWQETKEEGDQGWGSERAAEVLTIFKQPL